MAGQGLAGLGVAIAQFLVKSAGRFTLPDSTSIPSDNLPQEEIILKQALWYFSTALIITLLSTISLLYLPRNSQFRAIDLKSENESLNNNQQLSERWALIKELVKEQPESVLYIFLTFSVTLSIFPGLIPSARSTETEGFLHTFFLSICFIVFNLGDLAGRSLPTITGTELLSTKAIGWLTFSRLLFIPVFLMSHLDLGYDITPALPAIFANDAIFFVSLTTLALTNGYLSSILMMTAPSRTSNPEHRGTMASVMSLTLGLGLLTGSLLSFPVRVVACACNPF